MLEKELTAGVVHKADTLEDVAKMNNIPLAALKKSVDDYNKALAAKSGDEMGRTFFPKAQPMAKGPWYFSYLSPKVHHCMGGLQTDIQGRVIGIVDDSGTLCRRRIHGRRAWRGSSRILRDA